jgi:precorrin-2 methylase
MKIIYIFCILFVLSLTEDIKPEFKAEDALKLVKIFEKAKQNRTAKKVVESLMDVINDKASAGHIDMEYTQHSELWDDMIVFLKEKNFYAERVKEVVPNQQLACSNCGDTTVYRHFLYIRWDGDNKRRVRPLYGWIHEI